MPKLVNVEKDFAEILIIEDDPITSLLQKYVVETSTGRVPLLFSNGKEAVNYLKMSSRIKRYLVLLDLDMPIMNGWDFIGICKKRKFNVSVIVVTSSFINEDYERAQHIEEVAGYHTKPLNKESLEEIMSLQKEYPDVVTS